MSPNNEPDQMVIAWMLQLMKCKQMLLWNWNPLLSQLSFCYQFMMTLTWLCSNASTDVSHHCPFLCDNYKTTKLQDRRLVESWKRPQFATLLTAGPHDHIVWWRHHLSITTATSNLSNLQPFNHSTIHHPLNWKAQGTLLFSALSHESCKLMKPLAWPNRRLWNFCCVGS